MDQNIHALSFSVYYKAQYPRTAFHTTQRDKSVILQKHLYVLSTFILTLILALSIGFFLWQLKKKRSWFSDQIANLLLSVMLPVMVLRVYLLLIDNGCSGEKLGVRPGVLKIGQFGSIPQTLIHRAILKL